MKRLIYLIVLTSIIFASCKKEETPAPVMVDDNATNISDTIGEGAFTSYAHSLSGKAILYKETNGDTTLRFENFNMTAGPDVYVYLSTTSSYSAANVIQIANLTTGYTNSNVNFSVSNPNYTSAHRYVLVYCVQFSSLFGYADLQ